MHKYTALALLFLAGCYMVQWSDITNSCCVSIWNMRSSQYTTLFSAQGLNWASIQCFFSSTFCCYLCQALSHAWSAKAGLKACNAWCYSKSSEVVCVLHVIWVSHWDRYPASAFALLHFLSGWTVVRNISGETEERRLVMSDMKLLLLLQRKWNKMQWERWRTPNHSPPRLLCLPSLMRIQMQRNFSKKTDLGSQCFMLQRIMQFLKFFFENICFPDGVTSWRVFTFSILFIVTSVSIFTVML